MTDDQHSYYGDNEHMLKAGIRISAINEFDNTVVSHTLVLVCFNSAVTL